MKNNLLKEITQVVFFTAVVFFSSYYFVPGVANALNTITEGFQVYYGNYVDINNIYGNPCKRVLVGYTDSNKYFVPTKSSEEWLKFNENKPNSVGIVNCPTNPCTSTFEYMGQTLNGTYVGPIDDPDPQCWLEQDLNVGVTVTNWGADNGIIEKRCYGDNPQNCDDPNETGLYTFNEALNYPEQESFDYLSDGLQGICPPGWHIPTMEEFNELFASFGVPWQGSCQLAFSSGYLGSQYAGITFNRTGYYNSGWLYGGVEGRYMSSSYNPAFNSDQGPYQLITVDSPTMCYPVSSGDLPVAAVKCIKDPATSYNPPGGGTD